MSDPGISKKTPPPGNITESLLAAPRAEAAANGSSRLKAKALWSGESRSH